MCPGICQITSDDFKSCTQITQLKYFITFVDNTSYAERFYKYISYRRISR